MDKQGFIEVISKMNRDQIDEYFKSKQVRTKKIYPLIILGREDTLGDELNGNKHSKRESCT